jgi:EPS-associated MarR family transcriptional regulator
MIEYKVMREIEQNPMHTQRTLAETLDISLGKANYVLAGLVEKGVVKVKKLKNHPDKIRWQYVLTPAGVKEKLKKTREYLRGRLKEYEDLQAEIAQLKRELPGNGKPRNIPRVLVR